MNSGPAPETTSSSLIDFLSIITKHRVFVSRFIAGATLGAIILALILPKWYKSTASIFPAEKSDLLGALGGLSSLVTSFSPNRALSALGGNPEADRYIAILQSSTVVGAVIRKFDLVNVYGYEGASYASERTSEELLSNVEVVAQVEGNITVAVYDKDPQRAADMANYFVEMLNRTNAELQVQNARANRQFIEERYMKNLSDLAAAEDSMRTFQQRNGVIALPEQTAASITAAAEINAQLAIKEVEAGVFARTFTPDHPSVVQAAIEIDELRRKLREMNSGPKRHGNEMRVFVPFSEVPELGSEYLRRYREVEIQSKILEFITPLYEQSKVEENRQTPSVVVLDRASPAERKAKPKATLYGLLAFILSTLLALVTVFFLELLEKLRTAYPDRFNQVLTAIRVDWFGLRIKRKPG